MNSAQATTLPIMGALVVYVLSRGPVARVLYRHPSADGRRYYPLFWVGKKVPALDGTFDLVRRSLALAALKFKTLIVPLPPWLTIPPSPPTTRRIPPPKCARNYRASTRKSRASPSARKVRRGHRVCKATRARM